MSTLPLRDGFADRAHQIVRDRVLTALPDLRPRTRLVLGVLLEGARHYSTARRPLAQLGVPCQTIVSRFYRASLPSPRDLVCAAHLAVFRQALDSAPGLSAAQASAMLGRIPQSMFKTLVAYTGAGFTAFRAEWPVSRLLSPWLDTAWGAFDALRPDEVRVVLDAQAPLVAVPSELADQLMEAA
jgi:hypothetical protein